MIRNKKCLICLLVSISIFFVQTPNVVINASTHTEDSSAPSTFLTEDGEETSIFDMPELSIVNVSLTPAYPIPNENVDVNITVQNTAMAEAQDVSIGLFSSSGRNISRRIDIMGLQTIQVNIPWTAPNSGEYTLTAILDQEEKWTELDRSDNFRSQTVIVAPRFATGAELEISKMEIVELPTRQRVLKVTIQNSGLVSSQVPLTLYVNDQIAAETLVRSLSSRESIIVTIPWSNVIPSGRLRAEINPRFRSQETNIGNNQLFQDLLPDIDLSIKDLTVQASQIISTEKRSVTIAFQVINTGRKATEIPFDISISPGLNDKGSYKPAVFTLQNIATGEAVYVTFSLEEPPDEFDFRIEIDTANVIKEGNEINNIVVSHYKNPTPDVGRWISLGPSRITGIQGYTWTEAGGLITALAIDPKSSSTIYAGSNKTTGVWKTTDGGTTWHPIADSLPSLQIGAIAVDPVKSNRIYVATVNAGIFRSENGGITWTKLHDNLNVIGWGGRLLFDPTNATKLYLTSVDGLYVSSDSGTTWQLSLKGTVLPAGIALDSLQPTTVYATLIDKTLTPAIYESHNGALSWKKIEGCPGSKLPSAVPESSFSITVSGNDVYAVYRANSNVEIYRTTNIGCKIGDRQERSWEKVGTLPIKDSCGVTYSALYSSPTNANLLYLDGDTLRRSVDGGKTFQCIGGYGTPGGPHADNHGIVFSPLMPTTVYAFGDGGIYQSIAYGQANSWKFIGGGIRNVLFYDHALATTSPNIIIGGTQDNGTVKYTGNSSVWTEISGGDGATVSIDPTNEQILYAMNQYADSLARSVNGGDFIPIAQNLPGNNVCGNFHWVVHPSKPSTMLAACFGLWRTEVQPPVKWETIFTPPSGNVVRIAIDASSNLYFVGTDNGRLYAGSGNALALVFTNPLPVSSSDIEISPFSPDNVYLAFSQWGGAGRIYRLVKSTLSPLTFTPQDITSDLPINYKIYTIAVDLMHPFTLYAGTSRGVYRGTSTDQGATWSWSSYNYGLPPNLDIRDLEIHPITGVMRAATFGRGVYEVNTDYPIGTLLVAEGKLGMLRLNDIGTGYGPKTDFLDVEVVIRLQNTPDLALGFQLRTGTNEAVAADMLEELRNAFKYDRKINVEYIRTGIRSGRIIHLIVMP